MTMRDRSVAIVGAGLMGSWHATFVRRLGARIAVICDPNPESADHLAARVRAKAVDAAGTWIEDCDVVHVCTPTASHVEWIERALEARCHVIVEKPLASTSEECRRLVAMSESSGLQVTPVHQLPFQRGFRRLLAQRQTLGDCVRLRYSVQSAGGRGLGEAERQEVLRSLIPHGVSLFTGFGFTDWKADDWESWSASGAALEMVSRCGGVSLEMSFSLRARPPINELLVVGTQATAVADLFHGFVTFDRSPEGRWGKLSRPFRRSVGLASRAAVGLGLRAFRWQSAYPGLMELLAAAYAEMEGAGRAVDAREILQAAELMEKAAGGDI